MSGIVKISSAELQDRIISLENEWKLQKLNSPFLNTLRRPVELKLFKNPIRESSSKKPIATASNGKYSIQPLIGSEIGLYNTSRASSVRETLSVISKSPNNNEKWRPSKLIENSQRKNIFKPSVNTNSNSFISQRRTMFDNSRSRDLKISIKENIKFSNANSALNSTIKNHPIKNKSDVREALGKRSLASLIERAHILQQAVDQSMAKLDSDVADRMEVSRHFQGIVNLLDMKRKSFFRHIYDKRA